MLSQTSFDPIFVDDSDARYLDSTVNKISFSRRV